MVVGYGKFVNGCIVDGYGAVRGNFYCVCSVVFTVSVGCMGLGHGVGALGQDAQVYIACFV